MRRWEQIFSTNLFGPVRLTRALLPAMRAAGRGRIVLVSSQGARPRHAGHRRLLGGEGRARAVGRVAVPGDRPVRPRRHRARRRARFKTDILELTPTYADPDGPYAALHHGLETHRPPVPPLRPSRPNGSRPRSSAPSRSAAPSPATASASTPASCWSAAASCPRALLQRITTRAVGIPGPAPSAATQSTGQRHPTTQRRESPLAESPIVEFEPRMLDRRQARRGRGRHVHERQPATEEVLGEVADASTGRHAPGHRRGPARLRRDRLVDQPRLPQAVPRSSCRTALEAEQEALREELILEVGCPRMVTHGPQLDAAAGRRRSRYPAQLIDEYPWETDLGDAMVELTGHDDHAEGLARTGRRGRRDRAVELPVRGHDQQARPGAGHRQHRRAQAGARHAVQRHPHRTPRRRAHRHPAGRRQRRHRVGPPRRRGAHPLAQGRPHLLHRLDRRWASASWRRARRR